MTENDKKAFRIAAIFSLVVALVTGTFYLTTAREAERADILNVDQFEMLATRYLPEVAGIRPLAVQSYPRTSPCIVQERLLPQGLAVGASHDNQGLSMRLLTSNEAALQFVENIPACWIETGSATIDSINHVTRNGVDIFTLVLKPGSTVSVVYAAVYRNVYLYTTSAKWQPWETVVPTMFKDAIDRALG